jgi:FKBP-type peptidyl-prolyl cis-trans isomerase
MILVNVVTLKVEIHYYGRLAAKQGWRFDSTYDHKDENGDPNPFVFVLGSGKVKA